MLASQQPSSARGSRRAIFGRLWGRSSCTGWRETKGPKERVGRCWVTSEWIEKSIDTSIKKAFLASQAKGNIFSVYGFDFWIISPCPFAPRDPPPGLTGPSVLVFLVVQFFDLQPAAMRGQCHFDPHDFCFARCRSWNSLGEILQRSIMLTEE